DEFPQAADLDAQPGAMRLVGPAHAEGAFDQHVAIDAAGPRFGERAREREKQRPARERDPRVACANAAPTGVDDERARAEQRFDLVEAKRGLAAGSDASRRRAIERG